MYTTKIKNMPKKKPIKKDKTLIQRVIDNSKEIIKLKNTIHIFAEGTFSLSQCTFNLIDDSVLKGVINEIRGRIIELEIHTANMLKAAYTRQYAIIADRFHLSTAEMQRGYIRLLKTSGDKSKVGVVLFLSDVQPGFLEKIGEGEIREYTKELDDTYLSHCKPVWKPASQNDLHLEHLKLLLK